MQNTHFCDLYVFYCVFEHLAERGSSRERGYGDRVNPIPLIRVLGYTSTEGRRIWCPEGGFWVSFWMVLGALRAVCVVLQRPGNELDF